MKVSVISLDNKKASDIELSDSVFGCDIRKDILFRVVEWQRAKKQAGTRKTQEISEVSGTTKKPFNQKGTGNARQGHKKAPHMKGGAVAHGPRVRSHAYKLPKKVRSLGLKSALSLKCAEGKLQIFSDLKFENAKTKAVSEKLDKLGLNSVLFLDGDTVEKNLLCSISNLKFVDVLPQQGANVYDILRHENLVLTLDAVKKLEERLGNG